MINLLEETQEAIKDSQHTPNDIEFIGSVNTGHSCTWEEFCTLADIHYDNGFSFGSQKVATDLIIIYGDGAWLQREEYNGSECWELITPVKPPHPRDRKPISKLVSGDGDSSWSSLAKLNRPSQ